MNIKKCIFSTPFGILLGHIICKEGLLVDLAKVEVILGLKAPESHSDVRGFLGHTGYYRKFIKGYAKVFTPLEELIKGKGTFYWGSRSSACLRY